MNMGLVASTNRHTAFDATVVFHEYMHGVTNRLVGGPMNTQALQEPQSKAMGEGWGDYIACTLTNSTVVGTWVMNQPNGIRSAPYDSSYPGHFGQLGQGVYTAPHRVGEIWCATLLEMNRNLNTRLGTPRGQRLAVQLVVDALKLSPANPNMIEMRDSILKALEHKRDSTGMSANDFSLALAGAWAAFAKFGMGAQARSLGSKFSDVVADFNAPAINTTPTPSPTPSPRPAPTPPPADGIVRKQETDRIAIPDGDPAGVWRVLPVETPGAIRRLTVHVDIQHSYVGDLRVALAPPGLPAIVLHGGVFSPEPDLVADYTSDNTPALSALVGKPAQGNWTLTVSDQAPGDTGALRAWGFEIDLAGGGSGGAEGFAAELAAPDLRLLATQAVRLLEQLTRIVGQMTRAVSPR
jgi:extracellular elastinolytic metalloproteinase